MKSFNCSINKTIQAETEEDAVDMFMDMLDAGLLNKEVQIFEYPTMSDRSDHDQPN